jgi:uncharacterized membrane-anchored protein
MGRLCVCIYGSSRRYLELAGYTVYEDFESYTDGVYEYDGSSASVGGHAIRILGYVLGVMVINV